MRILEECINAWPMQEMRAQIDALREAFSADKDKPFELRESFPYGTPSDSYQASPPMEPQYHSLQFSGPEPYSQHKAQPYPLQAMTSPVSAISRDSGFDSPLSQENRGTGLTSNNASHPMTSYGQGFPPQSTPTVDEAQWNPTPIFNQWSTAFSIPQAALASPPPPPPPPSATSTSPPTNFPVIPQQSHAPISPSLSSNPYMTSYPTSNRGLVTSTPQQQQQQPSLQQQTPQKTQSAYSGTFVSSKQWQQSVASVFDPDGLKRRWAYTDLDDQPQKRMR
jgi:hypothetical protein